MALFSPPLKVTIIAPGHSPKVNTHWKYAVRATRGGKLVAAKITAQIVDPVGGHHAVEFGNSKKTITNWPFKGEFRDFIIWPPESRGFPLRLRVIVAAGGTKRTVDYPVTPRA